VPQRVVFSWAYELPFGRSKPWLSSGVASKVFGGFQFAGSYSYAAGRPFTVFDNANNSSIDIGEEQALPNAIGTPVMPKVVTCWFYTAANPGCKGFSGANAFGLPNANVSGGSPGVITSLAADPSRS
jgi:hypothetical protein